MSAGRLAGTKPRPLTEAVNESRSAFVTILVFSSVVNLLMLTGPLYMLQIYDRVLSSNSVPTLIALSGLVLGAYAFQGVLDILRQRITVRLASVFDEKLQDIVHRAVVQLGVIARTPGEAMGPLRQVDVIRGFATSAGPTALLDAPWIPFYLGICFLIHPVLGYLSLFGALVLAAVAILTERTSRNAVRQASSDQGLRGAVMEADRQNAETIVAMGMQPQLLSRWRQINGKFIGSTESSADVVNSFGAGTKVFRMALQSSVLGLGAYLVILGQLSPGAMIMASIMMGRALAPIEVAVGNFRGFISARDAYKTLNEKLGDFSQVPETTELPAPERDLRVEDVVVAAPGADSATLTGIRFGLRAGEAMGLIGPSGAGKTSLARVIMGIWQPPRGTVRLDNAELSQWRPDMLGKSIGYMAQNVGLFDGTIAQNIARMEENPDSQKVLKAARAAGAHDLILRMKEGYDTPIGEGGSFLSAGQRQRIALARALYGDPFLILLDEPQSNLDAEGENALIEGVRQAKARGAIVILISHRPSTLAACDKVLVLSNGGQQAFGPRDEVLQKVLAQPVDTNRSGAVNIQKGAERRRDDEDDEDEDDDDVDA